MNGDAGGCGAMNGGAGAETSGVGKKKLGIDGGEDDASYVLACSGGRGVEVGGGDACHVCAV